MTMCHKGTSDQMKCFILGPELHRVCFLENYLSEPPFTRFLKLETLLCIF